MKPQIHRTAIVEQDVKLGDGTVVWDNAHIRRGATLGRECIVGGKATIAYNVQIGDLVKINSSAYICTGVTLETGVMVSASVLFTNDRSPRAASADLCSLRSSEPDDSTQQTLVRQGATLGAGAIVGPGIVVGQFAMVGMGAVVTRSVDDFHVVVGNPARVIGCVCRCGEKLCSFSHDSSATEEQVSCPSCGRGYQIVGTEVTEEFEGK